MLRSYITAVVLVACIFNCGDAVITGWTSPSGIATTSGTADGISIAENTALDTTISTFTATSVGAVTSYTLLTSGTPFSLDTFTGVLKLSTALDYETTIDYTIEVEATDDASAVGTATVVITITDVNEAPVFGQISYNVCATDGSAADTSVTTFSASDEDTNDTITYVLASGNVNTDFKIETAELKVNTAKTLDRAITATYILVVHATDDGSPGLTGTATYTVTVQTSCSGAAALTMTFITLFLASLISSLIL